MSDPETEYTGKAFRAGIGSRKWTPSPESKSARGRRQKLAYTNVDTEGLTKNPVDDDIREMTEAVELTHKWRGSKKGTAKTTAARYAYLRSKGYEGLSDVATKLGISVRTLQRHLNIANENGWLRYADPFERVDNEIVSKTVQNLDYWLDKKDKRVTIEAAKGTGLFKSHQTVKVDGGVGMNVLAIKFESVEGSDKVVVQGNVIGKPREFIDAVAEGDAQVQGGGTPLGLQEGAKSDVAEAGDSHHDVGEAQGDARDQGPEEGV